MWEPSGKGLVGSKVNTFYTPTVPGTEQASTSGSSSAGAWSMWEAGRLSRCRRCVRPAWSHWATFTVSVG